jgi:hypothetical protein
VGATLLAYLMAMVLAISGALKLRSATRLGIGILPGPVLELFAALLLAAAPLMAWGLPAWLLVGGIVLLVASSTHHGLLLRAARRGREASEARRLEAHLKYPKSSDRGDNLR